MISKNEEDTKKISKKFLDSLNIKKKKGAYVVGLYGNLGAGKTTFTKHLARHLGLKNKVSSPTFVIIKRYKIKHKVFKNFFHIDAYRLKNEKEILALGFKEIVENPENLVLVEWPEKIKKAMPKNHHKIKISHLPMQAGLKKEGHRKFEI